MQSISRRGFSQVVAAGAAMASAGAFAVVASAEEVAAASQDAGYDVVVIGAGTGGLSAACRLAEEGKKVALLEASSWVGGASRFVGGVDSSGSMHILGTGSWDVYNEAAYTYRIVEPEMGKAVVDTFYGDYVTWLESCELPLHRGEGDGYNQDWKLGWGDEVGKAGNVAFFDGFKEYADSVGVNLFFNTFGKSLIQDEAGRIVGVRAALEDGAVQDFFAENVILASGGFQCNKGLAARFLGRGGGALVNVGTPYSTGTGLLMAEAVGAQLAGVFDQVSLCILPYRQDAIASENVALFNEMMKQAPEDCYTDITTFPCPPSLNSVVIDLDGNQTDVNNLLDVKCMRAFAISDQAARDAYNADPSPLYATADDYYKQIEAAHGAVFEGETAEEFARALCGTFYMIPQDKVVAALDGLTAPFKALMVVPGTYYMNGGVKINDNAQVIGTDQRPIPGLYATIPCAGSYAYLGGVAGAGTTGFLAASHILNAE